MHQIVRALLMGLAPFIGLQAGSGVPTGQPETSTGPSVAAPPASQAGNPQQGAFSDWQSLQQHLLSAFSGQQHAQQPSSQADAPAAAQATSASAPSGGQPSTAPATHTPPVQPSVTPTGTAHTPAANTDAGHPRFSCPLKYIVDLLVFVAVLVEIKVYPRCNVGFVLLDNLSLLDEMSEDLCCMLFCTTQHQMLQLPLQAVVMTSQKTMMRLRKLRRPKEQQQHQHPLALQQLLQEVQCKETTARTRGRHCPTGQLD